MRKLHSVDVPFGDEIASVVTERRDGPEELLVFIHGLGCSCKVSYAGMWGARTISYAGVYGLPEFSDYSILMLDLPGFGRSSKPEHGPYTLESHAIVCDTVIADAMAKTGAKRVHLVAHSMGAAVALLLSRKTLSSVVSFANLDGNLVPSSTRLVSEPASWRTEAAFCSTEHRNFFARFQCNPTCFFDFENVYPKAFYKSACSLVKWSNSGQLLHRFNGATLMPHVRKAFFYGEHDSESENVRSAARCAEMIPVSNSGHFFMNQNPMEFFQKLAAFLEQSSPSLCQEVEASDRNECETLARSAAA